MKYNDYIAVHIIRKINMKEEKSMRNKRKTRKRRIALVLLVALVAVQVLHFQVMAADGDDVVPSVICMDGESLLSAVDAANDGDIIGISGNIVIAPTNYIQIGNDTKKIIIKRMTPDACISFQSASYSASIFLMNIIFDGDEINKQCNPLITVDMNTSFYGVTFQNCNTHLQGAAVNITSGNVTMEKCLFLNNHAESGGHIAVTNKCELLIYDTTLINGQADNRGGAIYVADNNSPLIMNDCTLTDNKATWGGGIFNNGRITMNGYAIYDNNATVGGADILNSSSGSWIGDSIANVAVNYAAVKIIPLEWVNDYNGGELPENVDASKSNTFMKMSYELMKTETEETEPDDSGEETPPETEEPENPEETETPEEPENSEESDNQEETETPENPDDSTESEDTNNTDDTENTQNPEADNSGNEQTNTSTDENNNDSSITTENEPTENISDTSKETTADNITSNTTVNIQNIPDKSNTENEPQTVNNDNSQPLKVTTTETPTQTAGENKSQKVQQQKNIRIEANGVKFTFEMTDGNISIVADKEEQPEPLKTIIEVPETFNDDSVEQEEQKKGIDWFQMIQTILLAAILFCILPMSKNGKVGLENRHIE